MLESLNGWEAMLENYYLITLVKGIKGLIFKLDNTEYFYTGIWSALWRFLNLPQVGMAITGY